MAANSNKLIGELAEVRFFAKAVELGYIISKPFGDSAPYDCLLDNHSKLFKVQIKTSVTVAVNESYKLHLAKGKHSKVPYGTNEVDIFACYVDEVWYIIPAEALDGKITVHLYPNRNDIGKFECYKNLWNI